MSPWGTTDSFASFQCVAEHASNAHAVIIVCVSEHDIQAGDIVQLHEGGPAMTVRARSQNLAYCAWPREGRLHYGTFEVGSLRRLHDAPQASSESRSDHPRCS